MEVKLKVLVGSNAGQEIRVPAPKFLIGRAEDCHMRPKSDLISRHHCVLLTEEQAAVIRDLGSRNGTFVNDERIVGERELKSGDRLKIGPLEFEVGLVVSVGAKKRPRVTSIKEAATRTAAGGTQDDVDVTEWLDNEGAPESRESTETREIDSSDTEEISIRTTTFHVDPKPAPAPAAPSQPATPATSTPATAESPGETQVPNSGPKQPPKPKKSSPDSGKAAADVLKKFFQRR